MATVDIYLMRRPELFALALVGLRCPRCYHTSYVEFPADLYSRAVRRYVECVCKKCSHPFNGILVESDALLESERVKAKSKRQRRGDPWQSR